MKITLRIDGKKRTYISPITLGASLRAFELQGALEKRIEEGTLYDKEHVEELTEWIVEAFGNQFTLEELLGGYEDSFFLLAPALVRTVVDGTMAAVQEFPNEGAPGTKQEKG